MFSFWRKKDFQEINDLEQELDQFRQKNDLIGIGFFGIGGSVKGLSLIYKGETLGDLKLFSGIISEIYRQISELEKKIINQSTSLIHIEFRDKILLTAPITDVVVFISIALNQRALSHAAEWFNKNRVRCLKIFSW